MRKVIQGYLSQDDPEVGLPSELEGVPVRVTAPAESRLVRRGRTPSVSLREEPADILE